MMLAVTFLPSTAWADVDVTFDYRDGFTGKYVLTVTGLTDYDGSSVPNQRFNYKDNYSQTYDDWLVNGTHEENSYPYVTVVKCYYNAAYFEFSGNYRSGARIMVLIYSKSCDFDWSKYVPSGSYFYHIAPFSYPYDFSDNSVFMNSGVAYLIGTSDYDDGNGGPSVGEGASQSSGHLLSDLGGSSILINDYEPSSGQVWIGGRISYMKLYGNGTELFNNFSTARFDSTSITQGFLSCGNVNPFYEGGRTELLYTNDPTWGSFRNDSDKYDFPIKTSSSEGSNLQAQLNDLSAQFDSLSSSVDAQFDGIASVLGGIASAIGDVYDGMVGGFNSVLDGLRSINGQLEGISDSMGKSRYGSGSGVPTSRSYDEFRFGAGSLAQVRYLLNQKAPFCYFVRIVDNLQSMSSSLSSYDNPVFYLDVPIPFSDDSVTFDAGSLLNADLGYGTLAEIIRSLFTALICCGEIMLMVRAASSVLGVSLSGGGGSDD